jgi:UDP-N-acetylglucosamine--N-acetylmuramyl-(pentapeptide) pyrophosphoryl-undecaprenol N-acetylglucosamine transferase
LSATGVEVLFAGTPDSLEERLVNEAGIAYAGFESRGLNRSKPWTIPQTLIKLSRGRGAARSWLNSVKPDVVAAFGGYACLPVSLAAGSLGIPLLVHEQNARPGLANRLLTKRADIIALSDELAQSGFKTKARFEVTGNPLRAELFGVDPNTARQRLGLQQTGLLLLVFGGSLGAHHLNSAVLAIAKELLDEFGDMEVIHLTGSQDYDWVKDTLTQAGITQRWYPYAYSNQMGDAYAAADLVLARAGATSLAEITALGKASLLVPYPYAVADEQTANAQRLVDAGAAVIWPDCDLDAPGFTELLRSLISDASRRASMSNQASSLGKPDATAAIVALILELAGNQVVSTGNRTVVSQ